MQFCHGLQLFASKHIIVLGEGSFPQSSCFSWSKALSIYSLIQAWLLLSHVTHSFVWKSFHNWSAPFFPPLVPKSCNNNILMFLLVAKVLHSVKTRLFVEKWGNLLSFRAFQDKIHFLSMLEFAFLAWLEVVPSIRGPQILRALGGPQFSVSFTQTDTLSRWPCTDLDLEAWSGDSENSILKG